ncbi:MAG: phenylalanine 4-monooxygenase [Acidobacteriota bacterium]
MDEVVQRWESYTASEHLTWRRLYHRMLPRWEKYANAHFLQGIRALRLDPDHIPRIAEVNRRLRPLTGFRAKPVAGYLPASEFFACLRGRQFPTTITIRDASSLDYLPEPDIFHDVAGHVPMHTDPVFADTLVRFGECARTIAGTAENAGGMQAMARFFWFTIEFGLMRSPTGLKAYGSGLLSSFGELEHALESDTVQRLPFDLERVVNQPFEIDHYQPVLFWVDGFEHLFSLADRFERLITTCPEPVR